ncbi:membrane protein [Streptomyces caatingaensis]|uniref:Membrane protein n=1 Tax=Streptomyces caatingaensis TaxID=1678637 RepID=A0A0K9X728_9ACTN|nr:membrane protein [Streptomyces caatingaensis]KNB49235.1 membrane protein [Streptomyces caatingaensis]
MSAGPVVNPSAAPVRAPEPRRATGGRPVRRTDRVREALRRALPALGLYASARLLGLAMMAGWAWSTGRHPRTLLGHSWDGIWYAGIARNGYGLVLPSPTSRGVIFNDLAFFPLFPGLVHTVTTLTPFGVVSAQLVVSWSSAVAAAWGIYAVGERLYGRRTGTWLVLLWGLLPHAIVQTMGYTESLMTALAAWSLYAAVTRRPVWAGALSLVAGLSRPNAVAVAAALICATALVLWRDPLARADRRLWAGAALAPLGWTGYVLWAGIRSGDGPLGYFAVQRRWGSRFDFGADAFRFVRHLFTGRDFMAYYASLAILVVALVALVLFVLERPPALLLAYVVVLCVIAVGGSSYFASKPRFLIPAFPLLLPLALGMARARPRTAVVAVGALAGLSFVYGTYLVTIARIPM